MKSAEKYNPSPALPDDVKLPEELLPLTEQLAENVHDVWAAGRVAAGWKYGPVRDDAARETPCLVPYSELPEEEKQYDRHTAAATIDFILRSGYMIVKKR